VYSIELKSVGLGLILSFFLPGLGHLYAGRIDKGVGILIAFIIMVATYFFILTGFIAFVIWLWTLVDVYQEINEYNEHLMRTGRPPR
jgi:TM2 domain-containing membrane protein YozV